MANKSNWLSHLFGTTRDQPADPNATAANPTQQSASPAGPGTAARTDSQPAGAAGVAWTSGQVLLDDFVVERELGEGGMGKVYLVRSRASGQAFAVKKAKFRDETSRRNFLGELQSWIDLPEHPHLAACRFFRTVGDEVAIFGEYVDGGALAAWLRQGRLTRLDQVLDVAIQFAWGLHAAHEAGLIHQDAKPGNVLLTADGRVKVADFGLSRARARAGEEGAVGPQSVLASWGGMTPAYCSPEQAEGRRLNRRTDVWSWGVSVLELFTGPATWKRGTEAPRLLDAYLRAGAVVPPRPPMPNRVARILGECFHLNPAGRWATLAEAADALRVVYGHEVGRPYPRPVPTMPHARPPDAQPRDRWTPFGTERADPRAWLERAFHEAGRDPADAAAFCRSQAGTRAAQVVSDLAVYEEAAHVLERLIASGRTGIEALLAELCLHKALVHRSADDVPGALALYDRAIELFERLVRLEGRDELAGNLAAAYQAKAQTLGDRGEHWEALALYDRAIALCRQRAGAQERPGFAAEVARAYLGKAQALADLGDRDQAVELYDQVMALLEERDGDGLANLLGRAYRDQARVIGARGDARAALALYDQAIRLYERPRTREGRRELANDLAATFASKARLVGDLGDARAALALYSRALLLYRRLVEQEGRRELADAYAETCARKADAAADLGDPGRAGRLYDRAIALFERLVNQEGRRERAADLARVYLGRADVCTDQGERRAALPLYDQALAILDRLDHPADVTRACLGKAHALAGLSDRGGAVALYDRAIALLEREVYEEARTDRAPELAAAYAAKAKAVAADGHLTAAVGLYDQAIACWERPAVARRSRRPVARAKAFRAALLLRLGDRAAAAAAAREAVNLLQAEIARTGRADVKRMLKWAANALRDVL